MELLVACMVTGILLPKAADADAVNVTSWLPGEGREIVIGDAVTPDGSPVRETATEPENPFSDEEMIVKVVVLPAFRLSVDGVAVKVKSGTGGGLELPPELPLAQPLVPTRRATVRIARQHRMIANCPDLVRRYGN
jgi:hypothetical protein